MLKTIKQGHQHFSNVLALRDFLTQGPTIWDYITYRRHVSSQWSLVTPPPS